MTFKEYKQKFPNAPIKSESTKNANKLTIENYIRRYGEIDGRKRYDEYREKQAYSNTFEYKQKHHGWSREQFDNYNASRAQTLNNMIKRYGDTAGKEKWEKYVERQKYAGSTEKYFIEKYGDVKGRQIWSSINKSKSNNICSYINKYGAAVGRQKYDEYQQKRNKHMFHSEISQDLFRQLDNKSDSVYYATHRNGEFCVYDPCTNGVRFFDYVDSHRKKCIEFHGDCFHANPKFYSESCRPNFYNKELTSADIWREDARKLKLIQDKGFETLIVWENDYVNDSRNVVDCCLKFLYEII